LQRDPGGLGNESAELLGAGRDGPLRLLLRKFVLCSGGRGVCLMARSTVASAALRIEFD
jgi:hypothetical protein